MYDRFKFGFVIHYGGGSIVVPTHTQTHLQTVFISRLSSLLRNLLARAHKVQIRAPNSGVGDPPSVLRRAQYVDSGHVSAIRGEGLVLKRVKKVPKKVI